MDPRDPSVYHSRSKAFKEVNRFEEMEADLQIALKLMSNDPVLMFGFARKALEGSDRSKVREYYEDAIEYL